MPSFRTVEDENGIKRSVNSFAEGEYVNEKDLRPGQPHWMYGPNGPYEEPPAKSMAHRVKDQVNRGIGRDQNMTFPSELLPRSERLGKTKDR